MQPVRELAALGRLIDGRSDQSALSTRHAPLTVGHRPSPSGHQAGWLPDLGSNQGPAD